MTTSRSPIAVLAFPLVLAVCFVLAGGGRAAAGVPAEAALYGFKPPVEMKDIRKALGEPDQVIPYDDGWVAYAFGFDDHYVVVETATDDAEYVRSIQLTGDHNPPGKGLLGAVDLGDGIEKAIRAYGEPEARKPAIDGPTGEAVPDTVLVSYDMVSFEVVGGKITSIKSRFPARRSRSTGIGAALRRDSAPPGPAGSRPSRDMRLLP